MKIPSLPALCLLAVTVCSGWLGMDWLLPEAKGRTRRSALLLTSNSAPGGTKIRGTEMAAHMAAVRRPGRGGEEMLAALNLAQQIAPADFVRYLNDRRLLPANGARDVFVSAVVRRWLATDPAGAVEWCRGSGPGLVSDALKEWTRRDPQSAQAAILARAFVERDADAGAIAEVLAESDPQGTVDFLIRVNPVYGRYLDQAFYTLAKRDTEWLLKAAVSLPASVMSEARQAVVRTLAESDFAAAAAWAKSQPDWPWLAGSLRSGNFSASRAAVAWAALPLDMRQQIATSRFDWSNDDPEELFVAVNGVPSTISDHEMEAVVNESVLQLITDRGVEKARSDLERLLPDRPGLWAPQLGGRWAYTDVPAARAWAMQLTDARLRAEVLGNIEKVEDYLPTLDAGPQAPSPGDMLSNFEATGPEIVRDFGEEEILATLKAHGSGAVNTEVQNIRLEYPAIYARWLNDPGGPGLEEGEAAIFAREWSASEPGTAVAWVASLPDSEQRHDMLRDTAGEWHKLAPVQLQQWADALPEGKDRETVMAVIEGREEAGE